MSQCSKSDIIAVLNALLMPVYSPLHPRYNPGMYIILIGWLYVIVLMSATESSWVAGIMTFLLWGVAPTALFLFIFGTPARRRARTAAAKNRLPQQPLDEVVSTDDGNDAKDNEDHLRQGGA